MRAGSMDVQTAGQASTPVERPSVLFYMSPVSHRLLPRDAGADPVCASFEFGAGLANPLVRALPPMVLIALAELPRLDATLKILFDEAAQRHCGRQAVLDRLSEVVIIQLLRELMDQPRFAYGLLAGLAEPRPARAINAMHAEPGRAWTLERLAGVAGMSRARFAARFRELMGTTPLAYLGEWRLGVAQSLLRRGRPIQIVAEQTGYASAFTARAGLSPTAWLRLGKGRARDALRRHHDPE